jgi:hypothetical protein
MLNNTLNVEVMLLFTVAANLFIVSLLCKGDQEDILMYVQLTFIQTQDLVPQEWYIR